MGEANYQVLADVYSTSQTYSKSEAVAKADVVDNLTSTATDAPLSAAQGKIVNDKLNGLTLIKVTKTITIPDGTQTEQTITVDLSDFIPSGKTLHSISDIRLSGYALPYIYGSTLTRVWTIGSTSLTIKSNTSAWNNYTFYATLFVT